MRGLLICVILLTSFESFTQSRDKWAVSAFDAPLISSNLVYDSITTIRSISLFLKEKFPFEDHELQSSYDKTKIEDALLITDSLFKVSFSIKKKRDESFAYFKRGKLNPEVAILMIPGSMDNQSTAIYNGAPNYHNEYDNVFDLNAELGDSFLYIKPNEDILAIHNGINKLSQSALVPTLINNGKSYTANYFIQIVALIKALKLKYSQVIVVGLSQGGFASLMVSLLSKPDAVVVASGYSILFHELFYATMNQPIFSNLMTYFSKEFIKRGIAQSKTKYLFSWEDSENPVYGYENKSLETFSYLRDTGKVEYYNLNRGHTFPPGDILRAFYKKMILSK